MESIDSQNAQFWNELCGTSFAQKLGLRDHSLSALVKFDTAYLGQYPYLLRYLLLDQLKGKRVLEVGLGYGTVSQLMALAGADLTGLDIAQGPVDMLRHRRHLSCLECDTVHISILDAPFDCDVMQGSILDAPFEHDTFDYVVAIGSYHHTGDLRRALEETYRILKPGGRLILMVYHAYSYRRWLRAFRVTFRYWLWDRFGIGREHDALAQERGMYDANTQGEAAPYTTFVSRRHLRNLCKAFTMVTMSLENCGSEGPFRFIPRLVLLWTVGKWCGTDIYLEARK